MMRNLIWALLLVPVLAFGADIQSPEVFTDSGVGATVNASRLNNHVNGATILPSFISDKGPGVPVSTDYVLYLSTAGPTLKKASITQLFSAGLGSISLVMPGGFNVSPATLTSSGTITVSLANQSANFFLVGPPSGSATAPTWRLLLPADFTPPSAAISGNNIDWSQSNSFGPTTITADTTFTFSNVRDGQTIVVCVAQDGTGGHAVTWPTVSWSGGSAPAATGGAGKKDIWTFIRMGSVTYGSVVGNFN